MMRLFWDRLALAITLMVAIPTAPAIALAWGGWLIHQWIFDGGETPQSVERYGWRKTRTRRGTLLPTQTAKTRIAAPTLAA